MWHDMLRIPQFYHELVPGTLLIRGKAGRIYLLLSIVVAPHDQDLRDLVWFAPISSEVVHERVGSMTTVNSNFWSIVVPSLTS